MHMPDCFWFSECASTSIELVFEHFVLAMLVAKLSVTHCLSIGSKSWSIPADMIKKYDDTGDELYLQIRASCFGLCNLFTNEKLDAKTRPTLRESKGLVDIIQKRNDTVFKNQKDPLFEGNEAAVKKTKKRGREKTDVESSFTVGLGDDEAPLKIRTCNKISDDLVILYDDHNVNLFVQYVQEAGIQITSEGEKREYKKSGKYAKAPVNEAGGADK